jgi:hypothetical protein
MGKHFENELCIMKKTLKTCGIFIIQESECWPKSWGGIEHSVTWSLFNPLANNLFLQLIKKFYHKKAPFWLGKTDL